MQDFIVILVAFGASMLTFFSGFGLGTLLTPVFLFFFPPELAVAATAIVHFANNLFKLILIGKHSAWNIVVRFGFPAILGAFGGAWLLSALSQTDASIELFGRETSLLNMVLGVVIFGFALMEILPRLRDMQLNARWLVPGGIVSGFFGGLSGHQGALRSAFLVKLGLSKEQFVATGVVIACLVDTIRISTYASKFDLSKVSAMSTTLVMATLAAFCGALLGRYLLKKVTFEILQNIVGGMMILISILLFLGVI